MLELARRFGAALVVGCIDEDKQQAQAVTRERKLAIAQRSLDLLVNKHGIAPEDIYFDALVFPVGTGDRNYIGSGVETIEGIRAIKTALPRCKTILGISNVSFGLPEAGREVLNSVMLYHCVQAGLDLAIVNSEKLERYPSIPEEERRLAEDLIWWRGDDPIAAFAAYFRDRKSKPTVEQRASLPLDERLALYILEGSKEGLTRDLDLALRDRRPLEIINGPLMKGMDEVGRLFNANQMIVAEVLQSAEAMKAAVSYLEPHMEKSETAGKGTIILATVKGDVHDIGKNLVDIILSNNGYRVINLGIKVPPEELIKAHREHHPDAIGLSGLLVKSAQMMVITAQDLKSRRNRLSDAGGRRGAFGALHPHQNRDQLRRPGGICQRRDERAGPGQSDRRSGAPRAACLTTGRGDSADAQGGRRAARRRGRPRSRIVRRSARMSRFRARPICASTSSGITTSTRSSATSTR